MAPNPLTSPPGARLALMGNEAIARGVMESGIYVVTGYPGTPSSEVIATLQEFGKGLDIYVEWAINERVAFEIALGASIGGARSLVTMKAPGLNVAADPLVSAAYSGVEGGLVALVADDPGPHTTQTEQDTRWIAKMAKLPVITPSDPQEAKDFVRKAVELSEALQLPVVLRTTTRVNHTVGDVVLGAVTPPRKFRSITKSPERFVRAGMSWNLERHKWLEERISLAQVLGEELGLNAARGSGDTCIVTEGSAYNYVVEALRGADAIAAKVVKLGMVYPLPGEFLLREINDCRKVLVIEELDPFVESELRSLLLRRLPQVEVLGKLTGHLPREGELDPSIVQKFIEGGVGNAAPAGHKAAIELPRPPPLCPGCPHRFSLLALKEGIVRAGYKLSEVPVFGDIGCYALGVYQPIGMIWTEHSMGASISMAMGLKASGYEKPVVAVIGDSTLFHSGILSLIEAAHKDVDVLVLVLDNGIVAMTGHQSTPSWEVTETGRKARAIDIEKVVRSLGLDEVYVVDPYDFDKMRELIASALRRKGVRVVIARHPCALVERRGAGERARYEVLQEKCTKCRACIAYTGCPAIHIVDNVVEIVAEDCNGCGLCARACKFGAIVPVKGDGV